VLLIRNKSRAAPHTRPHAATRTHERRAAQPKGDFIDVEASEVPAVETDSLPRQH
jgi:hypothetical protein